MSLGVKRTHGMHQLSSDSSVGQLFDEELRIVPDQYHYLSSRQHHS
jgi:hypothetical protein